MPWLARLALHHLPCAQDRTQFQSLKLSRLGLGRHGMYLGSTGNLNTRILAEANLSHIVNLARSGVIGLFVYIPWTQDATLLYLLSLDENRGGRPQG